MLPLDTKHSWMFVVKILLFCGMFLTNNICESSGCTPKMLLFVSAKETCSFPSDFNCTFNGSKLYFDVMGNKTHGGCCQTDYFNCEITIKTISNNNYSLTFSKDTLSEQDIVLMSVPDDNFKCMPSVFYNTRGCLLKLHYCLNTGVKNFRLSQDVCCIKNATYDDSACTGLKHTDYIVTFVPNVEIKCVSCNPPGQMPNVFITLPPLTSDSPNKAAELMKNLSSLVGKMGNSVTASITIGNITGVLTKLSPTNPPNISIGITTSGEMRFLQSNGADTFSCLVHIPEEASNMAVSRNSSFAGVLVFPGMQQDDPKSFFLNNAVVGIEMGAEINNLSHSIEIQYRGVNKNGMIASCRSWNGTGENPIWITDGCRAVETNGTITCQCSHLTFFALLMSPPPTNISASDFKSLTYITSIGCGLSMFFLAVAIFMHCVIRKGKSSQATKILMNLFIAMFTLNLSFLVNESIAKLGIIGACVAMAAVMHYTMLATFSWFFLEALHLYFHLWKIPAATKHYMMKMYITGWATPAIVVIALLATNKYAYMVTYIDDGSSAKMCWISDPIIHQAVNVGYYAIVFIFTISIFTITVRQIVLFKPAQGKTQDNSSVKTNTFSILGLFLLLGITWAFAFFSYGPLILASYYIFTILNSFQGFFLFIYYYNSSKIVGQDRGFTVSSNSTATSNTAVSPYQ